MKRNHGHILNAYKNGYAIPQFNIINLEWAKYILEECQAQKSPVFLGVSINTIKYIGGYNVAVDLVKSLIQDLNITVPVMLHLDHAKTIEQCRNAYDAGFDSIMIDASQYNIEDNIKLTNEVGTFAYDTLIEAEIGQIGKYEDESSITIKYTNLKEAKKFNDSTLIDMLALSLGSVHGIYYETPNIDFQEMEKINKELRMPLVLHGCSGLSNEVLQKAIQNGTSKMNFDTELKLAWSKSIKEHIKISDSYDPKEIIGAGEVAIKNTVKKYIECLSSKNRG